MTLLLEVAGAVCSGLIAGSHNIARVWSIFRALITTWEVLFFAAWTFLVVSTWGNMLSRTLFAWCVPIIASVKSVRIWMLLVSGHVSCTLVTSSISSVLWWSFSTSSGSSCLRIVSTRACSILFWLLIAQRVLWIRIYVPCGWMWNSCWTQLCLRTVLVGQSRAICQRLVAIHFSFYWATSLLSVVLLMLDYQVVWMCIWTASWFARRWPSFLGGCTSHSRGINWLSACSLTFSQSLAFTHISTMVPTLGRVSINIINVLLDGPSYFARLLLSSLELLLANIIRRWMSSLFSLLPCRYMQLKVLLRWVLPSHLGLLHITLSLVVLRLLLVTISTFILFISVLGQIRITVL